MSEFLERMFRECGRNVKFTDVEIGERGQPVLRTPICPHCGAVMEKLPDVFGIPVVTDQGLPEGFCQLRQGDEVVTAFSQPKDTGQ